MVRLASPPDWYDILGVQPGASDAEIGRAFRSLARRLHPDVGAEASTKRFSDVARAYEVLGHPGRRADYDRSRSGIPGGGGVRIPVRRGAARSTETPTVDQSPAADDRAEEREVELSISLSDSLSGTTAQVGLPVRMACGACAGSGRPSPGSCPACAGQGRHRRQSGSIAINQVCSQCGGSGARPPRPCPTCTGRGWVETTRELKVRVPAGVREGTRLRLRSSSGPAAGYARVHVEPDEWLAREGRDLVLRLPLRVAEAALGTALRARLPDGPVEITVPPGTRPGQRLRVAGRGVPGSPPGDLVVSVEVEIPKAHSEVERSALETLLAASPDPREGWPGEALLRSAHAPCPAGAQQHEDKPKEE